MNSFASGPAIIYSTSSRISISISICAILEACLLCLEFIPSFRHAGPPRPSFWRLQSCLPRKKTAIHALWLHAAVPGPQAMLLGYRPCHPMPRSFPQSRMSNNSNIFQHSICICVEASCRVAGASLLRLQDSWLKAIILVHFGIH